MNFVDRANDVDAARRVLGVSACASLPEVRAAWKRLAFDTHPDRNPGRIDEFECAKAAYDLLKREAPAPARPEQHSTERPTARRPSSILRRTEPLPDKVIEECREALEACTIADSGVPREMPVRMGCKPKPSTVNATDHIPHHVERKGRELVFVVPTDIAEGRNRVAVPTALLKSKRKSEPRVFEFDASAAGIDEFRVPDAVTSWAFPGARCVVLQFGKG